MSSLKGDSGSSRFIPDRNYGVWGDAQAGYGVIGSAGISNTEFGIGVLGSGAVIGVQGLGDKIDVSVGVEGTGTLYGISGIDGSNTGSGTGVHGDSPGGAGVFGRSSSHWGVVGSGGNAGVAAFNDVIGNTNAAYLASGCCAAWFTGQVHVAGLLTKTQGMFQIDHPLDPANKYLFHSAVESSEMKNIYDGMAVLDPNGEAVVELPEWFEPLNTDFRYQLTPIGAPGPNLYIAEEISTHRFKIAGGSPSMKVSWQVTGIRQDAWAKAHPMRVEEDKPGEEHGYYLHPELHGVPKEKSIERVRHPQPPQRTP